MKKPSIKFQPIFPCRSCKRNSRPIVWNAPYYFGVKSKHLFMVSCLSCGNNITKIYKTQNGAITEWNRKQREILNG